MWPPFFSMISQQTKWLQHVEQEQRLVPESDTARNNSAQGASPTNGREKMSQASSESKVPEGATSPTAAVYSQRKTSIEAPSDMPESFQEGTASQAGAKKDSTAEGEQREVQVSQATSESKVPEGATSPTGAVNSQRKTSIEAPSGMPEPFKEGTASRAGAKDAKDSTAEGEQREVQGPQATSESKVPEGATSPTGAVNSQRKTSIEAPSGMPEPFKEGTASPAGAKDAKDSTTEGEQREVQVSQATSESKVPEGATSPTGAVNSQRKTSIEAPSGMPEPFKEGTASPTGAKDAKDSTAEGEQREVQGPQATSESKVPEGATSPTGAVNSQRKTSKEAPSGMLEPFKEGTASQAGAKDAKDSTAEGEQREVQGPQATSESKVPEGATSPTGAVNSQRKTSIEASSGKPEPFKEGTVSRAGAKDAKDSTAEGEQREVQGSQATSESKVPEGATSPTGAVNSQRKTSIEAPSGKPELFKEGTASQPGAKDAKDSTAEGEQREVQESQATSESKVPEGATSPTGAVNSQRKTSIEAPSGMPEPFKEGTASPAGAKDAKDSTAEGEQREVQGSQATSESKVPEGATSPTGAVNSQRKTSIEAPSGKPELFKEGAASQAGAKDAKDSTAEGEQREVQGSQATSESKVPEGATSPTGAVNSQRKTSIEASSGQDLASGNAQTLQLAPVATGSSGMSSILNARQARRLRKVGPRASTAVPNGPSGAT